MKTPLLLLHALMRSAPFQPATNLWRAVELDAVQRHGLPPGRGLDLGCGDGKLTRITIDALGDATENRRWVGVDVDPAETALARESGLYENVFTTSAASIPEPDNSFDFVFSNSVLEHIEMIDDVLREAARLLRPGGRFICTVPGPDFHACLAGPLFGGNRRAYEREIDVRCAHLRYWSVDEWRDHLSAAGLQLEVNRKYLSQRQVRRWERLSAITGGLAYRIFGRNAQPIEIQRRLRLRSRRAHFAGGLGAACSVLLALNCPLDANETGPRVGCLLLDAVKPVAAGNG